MDRSTTTLLLYVRAKTQSLLPTTRVRAFISTVDELRFLRMVSTVEQFTAHELGFTGRAFESDQSSPNLPVNVLPLNLLLVIHILDESVEIEETVRNVLCNYLSMKINEYLGIRTHHPLILVTRIQLSTVYATTE